MKRVAVVGASGFVGRHIVAAISDRGQQPVPIVAPRLNDDPASRFHMQYLTDALASCDAVVNAAGVPDATESSTHMYPANSYLPALIAEAARTLQIRFVHISSAAVQGDHEPLDSSDTLKPFSPYSHSKALGEKELMKAEGQIVIYRPPGVHGPDRPVTRQVVRVAGSPLATVARPGNSPSAQAWVSNVADAAAFLATCDANPPRIVHHPHEGMTTSLLLQQLGGKQPRQLPAWLAEAILGIAKHMARIRPALAGHTRRLEVMWFGQEQAPSWLSDQGWTPHVLPNEWGDLMRSDKSTQNHSQRLLYGITAPAAVDVLLRGQLLHMSECGWDVHLVANPGRNVDRRVEAERITKFHPIPMTRAITPWRDAIALCQWLLVLRRVRPHAVNVSSPKAGLLGSVASFLMRVPTRVYVIRGARFETTQGIKRQLLVAMERVAIYCATDVVAISPSLKNLYTSSGLAPSGTIEVLRAGSSNGIRANELRFAYEKQDREGLRREYLGAQANRYCVLFLGRVTYDKGIIDLASAMLEAGLSDAVLLVIGEEEQTLNHPSIARLRESGRWLQRPHLDDVTEAFAVADVLCLPSLREGLGNVLLEASAVGLPVVGTRVTGVIDAVLPNRTGLIAEPRNPQDLATKLTILRNDSELAHRLGRCGIKWVGEEFEPEAIWNDLESLYRSRLD